MNFIFTSRKIIFTIAVIVYFCTALFSVGYFSADEHYQIIEFAGLLDGSSIPADLPWEYEAKIRPSIQPFIAYLVFKVSSLFSVSDPYSKALLLRLLTAISALYVIERFIIEAKNFIDKKNWPLFYILSYFLWFLPFINVRFSSETWSGLFFLAGVSFILKKNKNTYQFLLIGILLGFSFLFRYQIAFAIFGLFCWFIFLSKEKLTHIIICLLGGLIIFSFGILLDYWFYKELTLTSYNYFFVNIIENKASEFGTSPWYYYILSIAFFGILPIGTIILISAIFFVISKREHIFTWAIVPFFLVHCLVPHKEIRFLFPIINFVPFIIVSSYQKLIIKYVKYKKSVWLKVFIIIIISFNITFLYFTTFRSAGNGRSDIVKKIHQLNTKKYLNLFVTNDFYPKYEWILNSKFYEERNASFISLENINFKMLKRVNSDTTNLIILSLNDLEKRNFKDINIKMKEVETTFPKFLFPFFKITNLGDRVFILYKNKKSET